MSTNSLERGADRFMNEHMILIYPGSMLKSLDFSNHPRLGTPNLHRSMSAMDVLIDTVRKKTKRTVTPRRRPNGTIRTREYLPEAEVEKLINAAKDNRHGHRDVSGAADSSWLSI